MLSSIYNLVTIVVASLIALHRPSPKVALDLTFIERLRHQSPSYRRTYGPYSLDLFVPLFHVSNAEHDAMSYCPVFNIIETVALYHGISLDASRNPDYVTPQTWESVTSTRIANFKSPLSIEQVYSLSTIGVRNTPKGASTTPNRLPLHMLAIYTGRIADSCINPDRPRKEGHNARQNGTRMVFILESLFSFIING
jgi:hypothetical protein